MGVVKVGNYLYKSRQELKNTYEISLIIEKPDTVFQHFMCLKDDIIYVVQKNVLYGLITIGDVIRWGGNWKSECEINTKYSYLEDKDDSKAESIFQKYKNTFEIPVVRDGIFIGVVSKNEQHTDGWWLSKRKSIMHAFEQRKELTRAIDRTNGNTESFQYILYGDALEAEKIIYRYPSLIGEIKYCVFMGDKGQVQKDFHGICVCALEDIKDIEAYVIIAAVEWTIYGSLKRDFEEQGLREFDDFIWGAEFRKKIVLINANCHGTVVAHYLNRSRQFSEIYCIHPFSQIQDNKEKEIGEGLLRMIDVYIHQDIRAENKISYKLSDEYVRTFLKDECIDITIPNMVGMGHWMFPTQSDYLKNIPTQQGNVGIVYKDIVLDEAYFCEVAGGLEHYLEYFNGYHLDGSTLQEMYETDIQKLKSREEHWDIKISDFIEDNLKTIPCFVDHSHPSGHLLKEIVRRLALYLNIDDIDLSDDSFPKLGLPTPVLGCVKEYFGFEWRVPNDKMKNMLCTWKEDDELKEYIREYVWCFYGIYLED